MHMHAYTSSGSKMLLYMHVQITPLLYCAGHSLLLSVVHLYSNVITVQYKHDNEGHKQIKMIIANILGGMLHERTTHSHITIVASWQNARRPVVISD